MSGDRTTPRFDVVATTRRSWSQSQKRAIVAEIDVGGATLSEVARRHGMHSSLLFRWRKTLGSAMGAPPIFGDTARDLWRQDAQATRPTKSPGKPEMTGDMYAAGNVREIPRNLRDAAALLRGSTMLRTALGDAVVDHYHHAAQWEITETDRVVTDFELQRLLERA